MSGNILGGHTYLTGMCVAPGAHDVLKSIVMFTSKSSPAGTSEEDLSNTSVFLLKELLEFSS